MTVHEFPEGNYFEQNRVIRELIGENCDTYEHVMPRRLYTVLGGSNVVTRTPGECVNMLVDEDGLFRNLPQNFIGSYLYETDRHGSPIVGNIIIAGEVYAGDGIDFCGIAEDQFEKLYPKFQNLIEKAREII